MIVTVFLLVVMMLGYAGIVYGGGSQILLYLTINLHYSAGFIFAMTAWAGVIATAVYLLNAYFGDRLERRWTQLIGAIMYAGGYWGMYEIHGPVGIYVFYSLSYIGLTLWLWSMYVYIPQNYPTRMRSLGTGWTDGVGHLGAWGGVLIAGALFTVADPRPLLPVRHDPVRAAARHPDRDLREEPALPRARGAVPIAAGPLAG